MSQSQARSEGARSINRHVAEPRFPQILPLRTVSAAGRASGCSTSSSTDGESEHDAGDLDLDSLFKKLDRYKSEMEEVKARLHRQRSVSQEVEDVLPTTRSPLRLELLGRTDDAKRIDTLTQLDSPTLPRDFGPGDDETELLPVDGLDAHVPEKQSLNLAGESNIPLEEPDRHQGQPRHGENGDNARETTEDHEATHGGERTGEGSQAPSNESEASIEQSHQLSCGPPPAERPQEDVDDAEKENSKVNDPSDRPPRKQQMQAKSNPKESTVPPRRPRRPDGGPTEFHEAPWGMDFDFQVPALDKQSPISFPPRTSSKAGRAEDLNRHGGRVHDDQSKLHEDARMPVAERESPPVLPPRTSSRAWSANSPDMSDSQRDEKRSPAQGSDVAISGASVASVAVTRAFPGGRGERRAQRPFRLDLSRQDVRPPEIHSAMSVPPKTSTIVSPRLEERTVGVVKTSRRATVSESRQMTRNTGRLPLRSSPPVPFFQDDQPAVPSLSYTTSPATSTFSPPLTPLSLGSHEDPMRRELEISAIHDGAHTLESKDKQRKPPRWHFVEAHDDDDEEPMAASASSFDSKIDPAPRADDADGKSSSVEKPRMSRQRSVFKVFQKKSSVDKLIEMYMNDDDQTEEDHGPKRWAGRSRKPSLRQTSH